MSYLGFLPQIYNWLSHKTVPTFVSAILFLIREFVKCQKSKLLSGIELLLNTSKDIKTFKDIKPKKNIFGTKIQIKLNKQTKNIENQHVYNVNCEVHIFHHIVYFLTPITVNMFVLWQHETHPFSGWTPSSLRTSGATSGTAGLP